MMFRGSVSARICVICGFLLVIRGEMITTKSAFPVPEWVSGFGLIGFGLIGYSIDPDSDPDPVPE